MPTGKPTVFRLLDLTTLYLNAVKLVASFVLLIMLQDIE